MVDVQTLSIVIAAVSVVIGVVYHSFELRNQSKTRQTDLVMRLYSAFRSKEFQEAYTKTLNLEFKDYNDAVKRYGPMNSENLENMAFAMVGTYFEGIGVLLHRRLISIGLIDDLLSGPIKIAWEKMKPLAEGCREHFDMPAVFEWFEYLYNEMQKREQILQAQH